MSVDFLCLATKISQGQFFITNQSDCLSIGSSHISGATHKPFNGGGGGGQSSSQPMAVPLAYRRCEDEMMDVVDHGAIMPAPSSSHKSNYSTTQSVSDNAEESLASVEDEEKIGQLLMAFEEPDRSAVRRISAASNAEDLALMVKLFQQGYFKGEHHLEEIMYFENLRRSQLLQLLDKFRDVLIIYETEDPSIATLYTQT